ncbi:MAG TPA: hypothetical protein VL053_14285 [Arachidicoccus sp.]|nr:hypothetical protein [Arachidicoccus sp.]
MSDKKNFVLRIDNQTYKALEKWAADEFRSVNGQIEYILSRALKAQFGKTMPGKAVPDSSAGSSGSESKLKEE